MPLIESRRGEEMRREPRPQVKGRFWITAGSLDIKYRIMYNVELYLDKMTVNIQSFPALKVILKTSILTPDL